MISVGCVRAGILVFALMFAWPLHAAEPAVVAATPVEADLSGHYSLNGVMETGSELLLRPDGHFQWYLSYGAMDLAAEGGWRREGDRVLLHADRFQGPDEVPQARFDDLRLRIDGGDLIPAWPWEEGVERGRYSRE